MKLMIPSVLGVQRGLSPVCGSVKERIGRLVARIITPRRFLHGRHELVRPRRSLLGPRQWVLGRGLCLFRCFILREIPLPERPDALDIRIRQWSPFEETGRYVVWRQDQVLVWIWDERLRREAAEAAGAQGTPALPETVLRTHPVGEAIVLCRCVDGYEGQIWLDGVLLAGRWWPSLPAVPEWKHFLLANERSPLGDVPLAEDAPWQVRPWGRSSGRSQALALLRHEGLLVTVFLVVMCSALAWQAGVLWHWRQQRHDMESKVRVLSQEVEPILAARQLALDARRRVELLSSLASPPRQLLMLASVARMLPQGVELHEWRYQSGAILLTLTGSGLDPAHYIKKLLENSLFSEARVEPGSRPEQLTISLKAKAP